MPDHAINNDSFTWWEILMPKVLKSTCRKLWSLSVCKKVASSLTFLRYCKETLQSDIVKRYYKLAILQTLEMFDHLDQNHNINL